MTAAITAALRHVLRQRDTAVVFTDRANAPRARARQLFKILIYSSKTFFKRENK